VSSFSVFLPVRNGWPYVQECVASILGQTHTDLELHVLDNISDDDTVPWLRSLNDERLKIWLAEQPLPIEQNWARVKALPKREFMTLIGHDDRLEPEFLAAVDALIARQPDAALYQTGSRLINARGRTIRNGRPVPERETAADYLRARFKLERDISGTGFVFRSADYDRLGGIPQFERLFFADDALWLAILDGGYKAADPRELCAVRVHPRSESASLPSAWRPILRGLNRFTAHLRAFAPRDAASRAVIAELLPSFLLAYHRNILIFALVDASTRGRRLDAASVREIEASLAATDERVARDLARGGKVRVVDWLNRSPLRRLTPRLWKLYYVLSTRSL
jgi:glycosyltransferase involved in cell wall biosynthesis